MDFQTWFTRYRLVILAMVGSFAFHGGLLWAGSYRGTYDAYVHIFFADHYRRAWFDLWEPRWYTGFTMVSYPPLTHQLTALLSHFSSLPTGFIIVMLTASVTTTLGVYRFSRLWVDQRPATYAALLAVFSSSIAETVHVFGQLPTMFVMGVMLNALPFVWYWTDKGTLRDLLRGWALLMVAAAGHHVTTLFGMVFFSGPILTTVLLRKFRTPHPTETEIEYERLSLKILRQLALRRIRRVLPAMVRAGIFGVGLILILVMTVLPYWLWSSSDPITQITIPHASRDSFIENQPAGFVFFVIPWGMLFLVLPYAFYKGFSSPNWILASSLALLSLLGTGGTTPIPAILLQAAFYILTLDRFTFWATIIILPFAGQFVESLLHGRLGNWIAGHVGTWWRYGLAGIFGLGMISFALFTANLTQFKRFQPAPVDMQPIVEFLAKDNHDNWRYLTLGFGDQMAWLSAQTTALNVEGNYHSARRLPELTSTPIERLDGAKFTEIPGLGSLQQFLTNPQRYNLKYVFVNDDFYEPLLYFAGWHKLGQLENDVQVWERADVPPLPAAIPVQVYPTWQRLMWGILPVGSLVVTAVAFFITGVVMPHINVAKIPILRWVIRWWVIRFWLIDDDIRPVQPASLDWQLWRRFTTRLFPPISLAPIARRAIYGLVLLGLLLGGLGGGAWLWREETQSPEAILLAYYDDIDFKRFSESYSYLETDLTQEEYLRWLSLQGGLLASFAKLDNLHTTIHSNTDGSLNAHVQLDWLTALGTYTVEEDHQLIKTPAGWRIVLDVPPPPLPRETLVSTATPVFYFDLPLNTLDETALSRGVLDRTAISLGQLRVVYHPDAAISFAPESYDAGRIEGRFKGLISVVGVVQNIDSYPAQVTLTAILRDADGVRLAETNVMDVMTHQLLPQEVTPFRIDFAGADAALILDIDEIARVEIVARAIPTSYNLARPLVVMGDGTIYNSSTTPVDIPQLLITYTDDDGQLLWVIADYIRQAIDPAESTTYTVPTVPDGLQILDLPIVVGGIKSDADWRGDIPPMMVHGYSR